MNELPLRISKSISIYLFTAAILSCKLNSLMDIKTKIIFSFIFAHVFGLFPSYCYAQSESQFGSTWTSEAPGNVAWTDPVNADADDASVASGLLASLDTSEKLHGDVYGFSIPAGATIDGIQVTIERNEGACVGSNVRTKIVRLYKANTASGESKGPGADWTGTVATETWGDATDKWANTWNADDINHAGFGVHLIAEETAAGLGCTMGVDYLQITVWYTAATVSVSPTLKGVQIRGVSFP